MTAGTAATTLIGEAGAPARGIFEQPKGLYYLAATEAWERFSNYGMTGLVVLDMVNQLLLPGHVESIAGFTGFRATLERVFGPMSTQALASQIFGLYSRGLSESTPSSTCHANQPVLQRQAKCPRCQRGWISSGKRRAERRERRVIHFNSSGLRRIAD